MRILILHSRYLSGPISGENRVVDEEADLLRAGGHDVETLSPSPDAFPARALAGRSIASIGTGGAVRGRVRARDIDIVHCHNLYPTLGPRVLEAAAGAGAAVVLTLHNYRLMCLAATFYRDGHVCEDCLGRVPLPGVVHACYRGSRSQSAVLAASLTAARAMGTFSSVHRFLAVSGFIRDKHVEAGFPEELILVKPNVVPAQQRRDGPGEYFLVLSRLSVEKNVAEVVRAWDESLGELRIVGDGPERHELERLARGRGVRLMGPVEASEVPSVLAQARALFLPSAWFEGQPRAVLEAYAAGVPVVSSRIGGLAEVVLDGRTGITVELGDREAWASAARLLSDDGVSSRYGAAAHACWQKEFSPERGLARLEAAYAEALEERNAR